ncbi:MAG: site-specific integrase [Desulfobacterales bacterium]|nr:site-specific integrase [Desulfobacterales bacterium]
MAVAVKSIYQNRSSYVLVPRAAAEIIAASLGPQTAQVSRQAGEFDSQAQEVFLQEFRDACRIDWHLKYLTIKGHLLHTKRLLDFLGKHPIYATRQELRKFFSIDTAQNATKSIRVLYKRFLNSDLASCFEIRQTPPHPVLVPNRLQLRKTYENLRTSEARGMFLLLASSGGRIHEAAGLTLSQIDLEKRMILPSHELSRTKFQWVSFFNCEAKAALEKMFEQWYPLPDQKIFTTYQDTFTRQFKKASKQAGFKITSQVLREWFCNEMGKLKVPDRYVDAFCGRVPKKVLGRHYTDYSPENLKEIYDKADLRVLDVEDPIPNRNGFRRGADEKASTLDPSTFFPPGSPRRRGE